MTDRRELFAVVAALGVGGAAFQRAAAAEAEKEKEKPKGITAEIDRKSVV